MSSELVIAAGGLLVAALSVVTSVLVAGMSLRSQRQLARDEWLWDKRSEAYIALVQYQRTDPGFAKLLPPDVASQLIAFGSEEINRALDVVRRSPGPVSESIDALVGQMRRELQGPARQRPSPRHDSMDEARRFRVLTGRSSIVRSGPLGETVRRR